MENKIVNSDKQLHIYTNAGFVYDYGYSVLFNELFKTSERLQKSIDFYLKDIGSNYISISARFLDLFGDFNETCGYEKNCLR